jgi:two-component system NarL family response regulator
MTIRVAIAEDQRMIREAFAATLAREQDMAMVGEATTGAEALTMAASLKPDVLVLDIGLPQLDGIGVARELRARGSEVRVLALSVHTDRHHVMEMLKAGAHGYVVKSGALTELAQAIRAVAERKLYLSPEVARVALGDQLSSTPGRVSQLGLRERQVLALLAEGRHSREIALELHISLSTVEAHRRNIMRKLDLHTIAELTRFAVREGLTRP